MSLIAGGLALGLGAGLFGKRAGNKQFNAWDGMNRAEQSDNSIFDQFDRLDQSTASFLNDIRNPRRGFSEFQRLAQDAGPSRQDLMSLAARTGGSQAAAQMQGREMGLRAGDMATQNFGAYRRGLDNLAVNLNQQRTDIANSRANALNAQNNIRMNRTQMQFNDFSQRRASNTSFWNNIAQMGFGVAGNTMGNNMAMGQNAFGFNGSGFNPMNQQLYRPGG